MQRAAKSMSFAGRKTNHSVRKTTVQTLSKAGVPPQQIIKITGHKNVSSLQHYDTVSNDDHRRISGILTDVANQQRYSSEPATVTGVKTECPAKPIANSPITKRPLSPLQPKTENALAHAHTIMKNCTFNITLAPKVKRSRPFVIESDSDSQ